MEIFKTKLSNITKDIFLRNDVKYHNFITSKNNWNIFGNYKKKLIMLGEILEENYQNFIFEDSEIYKGVPTGEDYIDEDGKIIQWDDITKENHPNRLKYLVTENNILISSIRLAKSPAFINKDKDLDRMVFSNGFYIFNVKKDWNKTFICHLLRHQKIKKILNHNIYRGLGISAYKVSDLFKVKVPFINKNEQDKIAEKIIQIEKEIDYKKKNIISITRIIDEIFEKEFNFRIEELNKLKKIKNYISKVSDYGNNQDVRFSFPYHHQSKTFILNLLKKTFKKKIKDYLLKPIELGATISPKDFDKSGDAYYVSMESLKKFKIQLNESQLVSQDFFDKNKNKTINNGDILMTRSGVAIGKFALCKETLKGIFSDFTMRISLKNYNQEFAYYYFRSSFFQHLIHSDKKGLQNKNIFPIQIREFPMPDIDLNRQNSILKEIKNRLYNQEINLKELDNHRKKIDELIEKVI